VQSTPAVPPFEPSSNVMMISVLPALSLGIATSFGSMVDSHRSPWRVDCAAVVEQAGTQ